LAELVYSVTYNIVNPPVNFPDSADLVLIQHTKFYSITKVELIWNVTTWVLFSHTVNGTNK